MTDEIKPDAAEIIKHIGNLEKAEWLDKKWWPKYVYHFTNLENAVSILEQGFFYSRAYAEKKNLMIVDNASSEVIDQTDEKWKEYVRLYFRRRTPTQYHNEGFKPKSQRNSLNAHCPFPIYFLLDARKLLTRKDTRFSNGNLAVSDSTIGDNAEFFKNIPFQIVYHNSFFSPEDRGAIIFHRHAEVIVKDYLNLDYLINVVCRSEAEYRTLLYLLPLSTRIRLKDLKIKIGSSKKSDLFERRWAFIEEVDMSMDKILIKFNKPSNIDSFSIRCEIKEALTNEVYIWQDNNYQLNNSQELSLTNLTRPESYEVKIFLDDQLMFADSYQEDINLPF